MDVLNRSRPAMRASVLGAYSLGLLAVAACNDLVGVDFGEAHLADADAGGSPPHLDAGHKDATETTDGHVTPKTDGAKDSSATHKDSSEDATKDAHLPVDASSTTDGSHEASADSSSCTPSGTPSTDPCVITETYGVFVAPSSAGGDDTNGNGSRAHPYATIGHGIASAGTKRVYVCAATYAEQLTVTTAQDGVQIYGGLACPVAAVDAGAIDAAVDAAGDAQPAVVAWSYTGAQPTVAPFVPGYALDVQQLSVGAHFEDMTFVAEDASALAVSTSSIAVNVSGSTGVSFTRITARAGTGLPGAALPPLSTNACVTNLVGGQAVMTTPGAGTSCACPAFGSTMGGNGVATSHVAAASNNGSATPPPTVVAPHDGLAGKSGTVIGSCTAGDVGASGAAGTAGNAGQVNSLTANSGGTGTAGDPGEGGGGGGSVTYAGGGGGGGGCGGNGGAGGSGGGASIAVNVTMSTVSFASASFVAGAGGAGVNGQDGEPGQPGGAGGSGSAFGIDQACAGGAGGPGGGGGGGGGGAGGISAGIAWAGTTPPTIDGQPTMTATSLPTPSAFTGAGPGAGGAGGMGGAATSGGNAGPAGAAGATGLTGAVVPL